MFLRWPAAIIFTVVIGWLLFKIFTWALNSRRVSRVVQRALSPRAETVEEIADDLSDARQLRDDRIDQNQAAIDKSVEETSKLRQL